MICKPPTKRKKVVNADLSEDETSEEELTHPLTADDSDDELDERYGEMDIQMEHPHIKNIKPGRYALVRYASKRQISHFIGVILVEPSNEDTVEIKCMKRQALNYGTYICLPRHR